MPEIKVYVPANKARLFGELPQGTQNGSGDPGFSYILAHEIGHTIYLDQNRMQLTLFLSMANLALILLTAIVMMVSWTKGIEILETLALPCGGVIINVMSLLYLLRLGEFYADDFAVGLLGRDAVIKELRSFANREKYIQYSYWYLITHPTLTKRLNSVIGNRSLRLPALVSLALTSVQVVQYLIILPFIVGAAALSSMFVIAVFAWGLGGGSIALLALPSLCVAWIILTLLAPVVYSVSDLVRNHNRVRMILTLLGCCAMAVVAWIDWRITKNVNLIGEDGLPNWDQAFGVVVQYWLMNITFLLLTGVVLAAGSGLSRLDHLPSASRRCVLFSVVWIAAAWLLQVVLFGNGIPGSIYCIVAAVLSILTVAVVGQTPAETSSPVQILLADSLCFAIDVTWIRIVERFMLATIFGIINAVTWIAMHEVVQQTAMTHSHGRCELWVSSRTCRMDSRLDFCG